jgi:hypothetical protein
MKTLAVGIIIVFSLLLIGCPFDYDNFSGVSGSGNLMNEQRSIAGVTEVALHTIGHLHISLGDKETLRVEAEDNLQQYIRTDMNNGELNIHTHGGVYFNSRRSVHYYLTVKSLNSIGIYSSGDVEASNLKSSNFTITVASSGDLRMGDLETNSLKVNISSSGNVNVGVLKSDYLQAEIISSGDLHIGGGEVKKQQIVLHSSGDYSARNLESDEANTILSSSGDATVRVRGILRAQLNSSGDLHYLGDPRLEVQTTSSGRVSRIGF